MKKALLLLALTATLTACGGDKAKSGEVAINPEDVKVSDTLKDAKDKAADMVKDVDAAEAGEMAKDAAEKAGVDADTAAKVGAGTEKAVDMVKENDTTMTDKETETTETETADAETAAADEATDKGEDYVPGEATEKTE